MKYLIFVLLFFVSAELVAQVREPPSIILVVAGDFGPMAIHPRFCFEFGSVGTGSFGRDCPRSGRLDVSVDSGLEMGCFGNR